MIDPRSTLDPRSTPHRPGPLSATVSTLCERLAQRTVPDTAAGLQAISRRLSGPLQVIVAGRVSAGKSTLVNALIGRRVAETGAAATTDVPARYRYGPTDRTEPVGSPVRWLDVTVPAAPLRDLTIVDTPGTGSTARPDPVLVGTAEAMLYVLNQTVRADDAATLAAFDAAGSVPGPCATIAVLSKADTVTGSAADLAAAAAAALGPRVTGVLPMTGLFAETAETGRFDVADATALQALAGLGAAERDLLLSSVDEFLERDVAVPVPDRQRLLERLDLAGVRALTDALAADPALTVAAQRRRLVELSGLPELHAHLREVLLDRADAVKAGAALSAVTELCRADPAAAAAARDGVQALLARPESHQLRLLEALTTVSSGRVELDPDLAAEVVALSRPGSAPSAEFALERAQWWRSYAGFGATPDQARIAEVVHRAYFLRYQELSREMTTK